MDVGSVSGERHIYLTTRGRKTGRPHNVELMFAVCGKQNLPQPRRKVHRLDEKHPQTQSSRVQVGKTRFKGNANIVTDADAFETGKRALYLKYYDNANEDTINDWFSQSTITEITTINTMQTTRHNREKSKFRTLERMLLAVASGISAYFGYPILIARFISAIHGLGSSNPELLRLLVAFAGGSIPVVFFGLAFLVFYSLKRKSKNHIKMPQAIQLLLLLAAGLVTFGAFYPGYLYYSINLELVVFSLDFFFFSTMAFLSLYYLLVPIRQTFHQKKPESNQETILK